MSCFICLNKNSGSARYRPVCAVCSKGSEFQKKIDDNLAKNTARSYQNSKMEECYAPSPLFQKMEEISSKIDQALGILKLPFD